MEETPRIALPREESRRKSLEAKLEEYRKRLQRIQDENPSMHPGLIRKISIKSKGLGYRIDILERLLREGEVDTYRFSLELAERDKFFDSNNYDRAAGIIDDYCKTGGQNLSGGTGLPQIN